MSTCCVLRCAKPVQTVVPDNNAVYRVEYGVCLEHAAEIAAGARWHFDDDQRVILMGSDLESFESDLLQFQGFTLRTVAAGGSDAGPRRYLTITATRSTGGSSSGKQTMTMEISPEQLSRFVEQLARFAGLRCIPAGDQTA